MHNILLSLDSSLYVPSLTLINSIIRNNEKNVRFFILVNEKKEGYQNLLERKFKNVEFFIKKFTKDKDFFDEHLKKLKNKSEEKNFHIFNVMNFARFYLPIIFTNIDFGIYLDIDMIVRANFNILKEEFDYEKKDFDIISPLNMELEHMELDKIGYTGKGFNAGFFVWNMKKYREQNLIDKMKELILFQEEKNAWKLGTQPILNIMYYQKVTDINPMWNLKGFGRICANADEESHNYRKGEQAYVIHWSRNVKPWENENVWGYKHWSKYLITNS